MAPEIPLYNTVYTFDIHLKIDVRLFQLAFQRLIGNADSLRTIFQEEDTVPYQTILPKIEYDLELVDFTTESGDDKFQNWVVSRSRIPIDLSKCPFDSVLIKAGENRFIWFLNIHHIVTDAISTTLLHRKMFENYCHLTGQDQIEMDAFPKFDDYVIYENEQRTSKENRVALTYWGEKNDAILTPPKLYGAENKSLETASERVKLSLGAERSEKLKKLLLEPQVRSLTPRLGLFNLFSTLLFTYLYRVGDQKKITIGTTSHNRPNQQFRETPGLLIEIFPLVMELNDGDSFLTVLQRCRLETNDFLRHGKPGMSTADTTRSFNVILNYMTSKFDSIDGIPMESEWVHAGHNDPTHHIRFHVYDFDDTGNLEIDIDLNKAVFHEEKRDLVPKHFLNLIDALLENIDQPILNPSLITKKEKKLLQTSSETFDRELNTVVSSFENYVKKDPEAIAVRLGDKKITYQKLNSKANQLANYLKKDGIVAKDVIGVHLNRSPEYLISVLAILKLGATFVPISSDQPLERIDHIVKDSNSTILLTNSKLFRSIATINVDILNLDRLSKTIEDESIEFKSDIHPLGSIAYMIYTSGSTGMPKGVLVSNAALTNYISWAKGHYAHDEPFIFALCTSIGFDLTITSTFLPLVTGGELIIYPENSNGPDIAVMQVVQDNLVNSIKLTPSHLALLQETDLSGSKLRLMVVGGEDFKTSLAHAVQNSVGPHLRLFNEYGPTEATVGCIVSEYDKGVHKNLSVPIGKPITNMSAHVLDANKNLAPIGVVGELYLGGKGLATGYSQNERLTNESFIDNPFLENTKLYRTGDLVRWNENGELEYLGRVDEQVKLNGFRIELTDIESNLVQYPDISNAAVVLMDSEKNHDEKNIVNCRECGLPSSYPNIDFDENDVCHLCNSFKGYKEKTDKYFKTEEDLKHLLTSKKDATRKYDCLSLLSGGKDSTYVLARLIDMGLNVLAFTLDNGYISDQAKANINRITEKLGVDHIYGETEHMNKIFVDSLHRHKNVCNGCFKTIYTLSTKVALDKDIPFIITGLSRGQFFETRLTEELFWNEDADGTTIDDTILEARKLYHQEEDAIKQHLDTSIFDRANTFEKVQYVDFYRYSDVSLTEMLRFLKEKADWVRPTDTGRSTNCLINQAGIHVHKKERGYSNYSFPYSWDVRLGHKNRTEALEEINEHIDVEEVERMLDEIGYTRSLQANNERKQLIAFYTAGQKIPTVDLRLYLSKKLPEYMLPVNYEYVEELPLTNNGKVDKESLRALSDAQMELDTPYVAPRNEIEELMEGIWKEVLGLEKIGINDNFIALGGHSLAAIRVTARLNDELQTKFPLNKVFELPTIEEYSLFIKEQLTALLQE